MLSFNAKFSRLVSLVASVMLLLAVSVFAEGAFSGAVNEIEPSGGTEPELSVINDGCLPHTQIKRVNFSSDREGIIELADGHKVQVTLRESCPGIRDEGYVHKPSNGFFCQGDMLRVINYGNFCIVDKIELYTAVSAPGE